MLNRYHVIVMTVLSSVLIGCAGTSLQIQDKPDYADYSPGFTGYTVGYDGYGTYDDGYGPSFWNPRYNYYTGHSHGYLRYAH